MANSWLFNPGGHCCGGTDLFVRVVGCGPGTYFVDAVVQIWREGVQIDEGTTDFQGDAHFTVPGLGDYEIVVYHDDFPGISQDASTVPFTLTETEIQAILLLTTCGTLPPEMQISDGLGWSATMPLTPTTDVAGPFYQVDRIVVLSGIRRDEALEPPACALLPDAQIRVRYRLSCSEGFILQVSHTAGGNANRWYDYRYVDLEPSDPLRCPLGITQPHPGNASWFVDATVSNGALECDPFEAVYAFDFGLTIPPGNSGRWFSFAYSPTLWLLGPGPVTYTVTK